MSDFRTPLSRARGLGSAKHGVGHFISQRVSAIALVLLIPWALWSAYHLAGRGYEGVQAWLGHPVDAGLLVLLALAGLYHGQLGIRVVIEDYVEGRAARMALLIVNALAALAIFTLIAACVVRVSVGAGTL